MHGYDEVMVVRQEDVLLVELLEEQEQDLEVEQQEQVER